MEWKLFAGYSRNTAHPNYHHTHKCMVDWCFGYALCEYTRGNECGSNRFVRFSHVICACIHMYVWCCDPSICSLHIWTICFDIRVSQLSKIKKIENKTAKSKKNSFKINWDNSLSSKCIVKFWKILSAWYSILFWFFCCILFSPLTLCIKHYFWWFLCAFYATNRVKFTAF